MEKIVNNPKKKVGIYRITSPDNSIYIGGTMNLQTRCWHYQSMECKGQKRLYQSILTHGWNNHKVELIHELPKDVSKEVLHTYEELYITQYRSNFSSNPEFNGLNMTNGYNSLSSYAHEKLAEIRRKGLYGAGGKHSKARKVINADTGKIYECIKDAAADYGVTYQTLQRQLLVGRYSTPIRYID